MHIYANLRFFSNKTFLKCTINKYRALASYSYMKPKNAIQTLQSCLSQKWNRKNRLRKCRSKIYIHTFSYKKCPIFHSLLLLYRDSPAVWTCDTKKGNFSKICIFLIPMLFGHQNISCGTLTCPLSIWQFICNL